MKQKLLFLLLTFALIFAFAACGSEDAATEESGNFDKYVGGELTDLMVAVGELGYTATYMNQGENWTEILPLDETMANDFLVGSIEEDVEAKTVKVDLTLKSNTEQDEMESALNEKLEEGSAWNAVNDYGKEQYGDSFDLNYLTGKITASADDADTWFLKAECEVDGEDMTCEAKVTGTTNTPEVISFDVY